MNISWYHLNNISPLEKITQSKKYIFSDARCGVGTKSDFTLFINNASKLDLGEYRCQVSSKYQSIEDEFVLTVSDNGKLTTVLIAIDLQALWFMGDPWKGGEIPRFHYAISRLRKFQDCVEHNYRFTVV